MNIGLDVDGVLTTLKAFEIRKGIKYFKRNPTNLSTNIIEEMYKCTKSEGNIFWIANSKDYLLLEKARLNAAEVIDKLRKENYSITIITCRAKTTSNDIVGAFARLALKYWLSKEKINYDKIFFCNSSEDKKKVCQLNNIDIMIDDEIDNINEVSKVTNTILFEDKIDASSDNLFLNLYSDIHKYTNHRSYRRI